MGNQIKSVFLNELLLPTSPTTNNEDTKIYKATKEIIPIDIEKNLYLNEVEKISLNMKKLFKDNFYNSKRKYAIVSEFLFHPDPNLVFYFFNF